MAGVTGAHRGADEWVGRVCREMGRQTEPEGCEHSSEQLLQGLRSTMLCYAKSLQSCLTLCDPIDSSPPGFPVPGILQARTLEWVAISFSKRSTNRIKSIFILLKKIFWGPHLVVCETIVPQFRSVQSAQSCPTLCDPMNRSAPGLPVLHQLPQFTQTHVH